jgi:excisionase family DNA binding protein
MPAASTGALDGRSDSPELKGGGMLRVPVGNADAALPFDKQPNEPEPAIDLLTIPEAAEFLRVSKSSIRRLQHGRRVPFFKIGGSVRFARNDLVSYLARQRVGSVGE